MGGLPEVQNTREAANLPRLLLALLACALADCAPATGGSVVSVDTQSLDFGTVGLGEEVVRVLTFVNPGRRPVRLHGLAAGLPDGLRVEASGDELDVPAGGGSAQVSVACAPRTGGLRSGRLELATDPPEGRPLSITVRCTGVGPQARALPEALAFGRTLFPEQAVRKLWLLNAGVGPGAPLRVLSVQVAPVDGNTRASEFAVAFPSGYDATQGLGYGPESSRLELSVVLQSQTLGFKKAELRLTTNDPLQPVISVAVSAEALLAEPCRYRVTPTSLYFGGSPAPVLQAPVRIENLGTQVGEVCDLEDLALAAGSAPQLSLVGGPVPARRLQPGEALVVDVRVEDPAVSAPVAFQGELRFTVANARSPQGSVPIAGTLSPGRCLVFSPAALDFGTVSQGCNSSSKGFAVYNTCAASVTLTSFAVVQAAGQPAGGPNCPGTQPCPEFLFSSTPALPAGGVTVNPGGAPTVFWAKYRPLDVGADTGAIAIHAVEFGRAQDYVVTLNGAGSPPAEVVDLFLIPALPKVDILIVVDDSTSMADKQTSLASNFQNLFVGLPASDFHLGVITADDRPDGGQGRLIGDSANPKVLTNSTPDVMTAFLSKVNVGAASAASPAGLATALKAVTAPLVNTDNSGFLRADAQLSVVLVTDGRDQSPGLVADYLAALHAVKPAGYPTFSVIGPFELVPAAGCVHDGDPDDGRYTQIASSTNAMFGDICNNWGWWWTCFDCGGAWTQFFLSQSPRSGSVSVVLDGVVLSPPAYQYDPMVNAVEFEPLAAPEPGSRLEIHYPVVCLP